MKTRDELVDAFALMLASPHITGPMDPVHLMAMWFARAERLADAFVAGRERRAVKIENRVGISVDEATLRLDYDQANVIALALGYDASALPLGQTIEKIKELASRAPAEKPHSPDDGCAGCEHYVRETIDRSARCAAMGKAFGVAHDSTRPASPHCPKRTPETPAAEALRFSANGGALRTDGRLATIEVDGAEGYADVTRAVVRIQARDQQHAERIVAAMLPVGRGTK